jgi:hypothetical protein
MAKNNSSSVVGNKRTLASAIVFVFFTVALSAQVVPGAKSDTGLVSYAQFTGSSNGTGRVFELNSTIGYNFSGHFGIDVGVPFYFVQASASTGGTNASGVGNVFVDGRLKFPNQVVNFASILTVAAPTGDASKGLSTGRATFDSTSRFDRTFGAVTPFAEVGVANTVPESQQFLRPFTTLGFNSHFRAGTNLALGKIFTVGAAAYDILPSGQQKVFSRLVQGGASGSANAGAHGRVFATSHETTGSADIARDNGFSGWLDASPSPFLDFEIGYTHSVHYALDTVSFGIGVNIGSLAGKRAHP